MYNIVFLLTLFIVTLYSQDIKPIATIHTSGLVSDFVEDNGYLYVATDEGTVDIIDLSKQEIIRKIHLPTLQTVKGKTIPARVHSVDRSHGKTLLVSSGMSAYRNIWIDDGKNLTKIIDETKQMMPKKVLFTSENKMIFGSFGSELILYDKDEGSKLYDRQVSESTMGDMALSADKNKMVISDESGSVKLIDVASSRIEKTFSSEHVDNIYKVAYANGTIVTAGQDRRVGVYRENADAYHLKSDFLVYAVGLSPSGSTGAYSSGLEHYLQLFDIRSKKRGDRLVGHYAIPNKIFFINETSVISSGDENKIFFWRLNEN
ncbi:MAG TPA: nitrate reductase [Sulfurovum sp.]|nr:nitrate reductase [Sulfurovum sp.]